MAEIDPRTGLPKQKNQGYNQNAYVRGGAPANVAQATQAAGFGVPFTGLGSYGISPSTMTVPGFTPDYRGLIANDPIFSQQKLDLSAQGISDAASRAAATQRALAQFGIVPDFSQLGGLNQDFLNADVTPEARMLAERNTEAGFSIKARQQKQLMDNIRAIKNSLAARGALRSGEAGHQLQEAQRGFDQASFDTTQELVDYLAGVQAGFAKAEQARQAQLSQGAQQAAVTQAQLHPAQPDRQIVNRNGQWVYADTGAPAENTSYSDLGATPDAITGPSVGPYGNAGPPKNVKPPNANELRRMLGL